MNDKKIHFIKNAKLGSYYEYGESLSNSIVNDWNCDSHHIDINNWKLISSLYDTNIVFIKEIRVDLYQRLIKQNNRMFYIVVDAYPLCKFPYAIDGVIFANKRQQVDCLKNFSTNHNMIMYHHISNHLVDQYTTSNKIQKIGYFVAPENINNLLNAISIVDIHTNFNTYKTIANRYKFHVEYRNANTWDFKYKPSAKLMTAAACGSSFICSRDSSFSELLPRDYPYFLEQTNDKKHMIEILRDMYESYGSDKYSYSLECLNKLRNIHTLKNNSLALLKFLGLTNND